MLLFGVFVPHISIPIPWNFYHIATTNYSLHVYPRYPGTLQTLVKPKIFWSDLS